MDGHITIREKSVLKLTLPIGINVPARSTLVLTNKSTHSHRSNIVPERAVGPEALAFNPSPHS